jgi:hypothetical protein
MELKSFLSTAFSEYTFRHPEFALASIEGLFASQIIGMLNNLSAPQKGRILSFPNGDEFFNLWIIHR